MHTETIIMRYQYIDTKRAKIKNIDGGNGAIRTYMKYLNQKKNIDNASWQGYIQTIPLYMLMGYSLMTNNLAVSY